MPDKSLLFYTLTPQCNGKEVINTKLIYASVKCGLIIIKQRLLPDIASLGNPCESPLEIRKTGVALQVSR